MVEAKNKDHVVKHLEMIQGVVNRLGHDSFLVKGWSMALLVAAMFFLTRVAHPDSWTAYIVLALLIPVFGFWFLDGYFLWQERLFRKVYDEIRKQESTDFAMNIMKHRDKPKCNWLSAVFSLTLFIFYGVEIIFVLIAFFVVQIYL